MLAHRFFTVTVDTEEEWDWSTGYPTCPGRVTNVRRLPDFQVVCDRHGAAVTYFVNHAVLSDPEARRVLRDLAARPNVEIGLHVHPWNTPPLAAGDRVPVRHSFLHNLPPDLVRAKLRATLDLCRDAGFRPAAYRGGRYSTGPVIQDFLRSNGFLADCSVVPFTTWADDGAPDFRRRDLAPVRRAGRDGSALWELPLSLGFSRGPFGLWRRVLAAPLLRRLRVNGLLDRLGVVRPCWLNLENPMGEGAVRFLRRLTVLGLPAANLTLHSSSLLPGGNPYTRTPADVAGVFARAEAILAAAARLGFTPATASDVARTLEARFHARDRHQPAGQGRDRLPVGGRAGAIRVRGGAALPGQAPERVPGAGS